MLLSQTHASLLNPCSTPKQMPHSQTHTSVSCYSLRPMRHPRPMLVLFPSAVDISILTYKNCISLLYPSATSLSLPLFPNLPRHLYFQNPRTTHAHTLLKDPLSTSYTHTEDSYHHTSLLILLMYTFLNYIIYHTFLLENPTSSPRILRGIPLYLIHHKYHFTWSTTSTRSPDPPQIPPYLIHHKLHLNWSTTSTTSPDPLKVPPHLIHYKYHITWSTTSTTSPGPPNLLRQRYYRNFP